jgi:hypothetical protein
MANNVRVTELDFEDIKSNLKTYLRNQSQFTDYDFDASNLSVLIDLLAYNTHYNAVLANMVSNEMFLDTAIKRSSVVSLAKQISYTPRSRRAATALVNVTIQNTTTVPNFLTLNPYTVFTTSIDGTSYNFYNIDTYSTTPVSGVYTFSNVKLYQGTKLDYYWTVAANPGADVKYEIPNTDIDTSTLQVQVQYGGIGSYSEPYNLVTDLSAVDQTAKVYFLAENTRGYYEINFGDDVIGAKLSQGDVIKISYLVTDGADANVSTNVNVGWSTNSIAGEITADRTISTISKPAGGSEKETTEQVRFRSLNNYASQGRVVTTTDYATYIADNVPGADSVNVWGGESNDPPEYGKTFISIKPKIGYVLTSNEKTRIVNELLQPRSMMTSQHEFVDPTFTYVNFNIKVRYTDTRTTRTADQIKSLINTKVSEFMQTNLEAFKQNFYRSQLEKQLMAVDDAILSVNILFSLVKRLPLVPNVRLSFGNTIQLPIKVHPAEVSSSYFYFTDAAGVHFCSIKDVPDESPPDYEGTGTLYTYDLNTGEFLDSPGTINYGTGLITLSATSPLTLSGYPSGVSQLYVYANPQESVGDIFPAFNEILVQDDTAAIVLANVSNGITIEVEAANN